MGGGIEWRDGAAQFDLHGFQLGTHRPRGSIAGRPQDSRRGQSPLGQRGQSPWRDPRGALQQASACQARGLRQTTALSLAKERNDHECRDQPEVQGLQGRRHHAGRMGPARDRDRRDRDARPDGRARRIRPRTAARRRPHRGFAAHDHPDGRADRDAEDARRGTALGFLQHLLDPGPCRGRDRGRRHPGVRAPRARRSTSTGTTRTGSSTGPAGATPT